MEINDITYAINGAIFEVNKVLGPGFLEKVYENALLYELKNRGLKAVCQAPITVNYKGQCVGEYVADILVEDSVIIELNVPSYRVEAAKQTKSGGQPPKGSKQKSTS